MAYRPVRPEASSAQPMLLENLASGSERKSYFESIWVRKREAGCGVSYDVIADAVRLAPGAHDEGIIEGKDGDDVNALLAEVGEVLDVSGDVIHGAGGGEGAWYPALAGAWGWRVGMELTHRGRRIGRLSCWPIPWRHCSRWGCRRR